MLLTMLCQEALNGSDDELRELAKMELPELEEKRKRWKKNSLNC